jgi:hypothetical protein
MAAIFPAPFPGEMGRSRRSFYGMTKTLVSVIMPCFNHGHFVVEAVASVLGQTMADLELIIVDDASTDDSVAVIQKLAQKDGRIKLIVHQKNCGPSRSRNDGIKAATGEYVAFCDADDRWKPEKLARQLELLNRHPDCDIAYCQSEIIDDTGRPTGGLFTDEFPLPQCPSGDLFEALCAKNFINTQVVLARRPALAGEQLFHERLRVVEDWWLWIRLARKHRFIYEPAPLAYYRQHSQRTGVTHKPRYFRSRCKVGILALRTYPDMPSNLQAEFYLSIGRQLCSLGKQRWGRRFMIKGILCGWAGRIRLRSLAAATARLILASVRGRETPVRAQGRVLAVILPFLTWFARGV